MTAQTALSVSQLNRRVKDILDSDPILNRVLVSGEISNYKLYPSGHHYFTLKDAESSLRCVMFRSDAARLRLRPENGMKVICSGRVTVYPRDGAYQLYVSSMQTEGLGDLYAAFEELKELLMKEGLFDQAHKKPIPAMPARIAVITSGAGAAVRDVIRVLGSRWPLAKVLILPVRVQGAEAPAEIAGAISYANRWQVAELIITGRGGGSMEDLWAFNDERVARAIYASEIPVISAVGHEPDVTISDFVADLRAATPSNAAELAVPDRRETAEHLAEAALRSSQCLRRRLDDARARLESLAVRPVIESPFGFIHQRRQELDHMAHRLYSAETQKVAEGRERFVRLTAALDAMSPLKVMARGYSITTDASGAVLRRAGAVDIGETVRVRLQHGSLDCRVEQRREDPEA